jgi:hypothetical protein
MFSSSFNLLLFQQPILLVVAFSFLVLLVLVIGFYKFINLVALFIAFAMYNIYSVIV